MLVTNKYDKDTIVSFKIVNGDEIIAKIVEEDANGFVINKPCTVIPSQQGMGLLQTIFTANTEKPVRLERSHIMLHAPTIKEMENHYIQTTTGIQPAGGIIT